MFCSARLSTTDGRTDGRETRTGRKSSPRCSQSPGEGTGWNDATAYLDHGTRSVTRARTRSRTPRIPRGERVLVACAARVLLNISRVVAADETAAAARPLPVSPIPGKLFGGKGEIWTFARETSNAPGNRALSPTASRTVRACVRTRSARLDFRRASARKRGEWKWRARIERRTLRISVAQQPVLRAALSHAIRVVARGLRH